MGLNKFFSRSTVTEEPVSPIDAYSASDPRRIKLLDAIEESDLSWFWATDADGKIVYLSRAAQEKLTGEGIDFHDLSLVQLFSTPISESDDEHGRQRPLPFLLRARNSINSLPVKVATKKDIWWEISGRPQFCEKGEFTGFRGSAKDISAQRQGQIDVNRMAQYDALTGLANRHRMETRMAKLLTASKASQRSCAMMMLDLDRFKQVNDTLGHQAGDELLKQVAQRLDRIIGDKGEIGRLGGDEFQIILPDMDDRGALGDLAQTLIQMVSQPYSINGARAIIGTSVGIAIAPFDGIETDELVGAGDLALYAAKAGGRGQYRFYSSDLSSDAHWRRQIEEDLRDALATDGLEMQYQPLVDAKTNRVKSFEALVRWNHPERGWVSPAEFIPVAEETGQILDLGEWVIRTACRDAAQWPEELVVAINVSAIQFANENLPTILSDAMMSSGLPPERLELELTESVFIGDPHATHEMFATLKKMGLRLALDDFGTGYSSLGYLRNAPFDKIKIDQSFVRGACEGGNNNAAIITAIVSLAEALDMVTVAEGVEAHDELDLVRELGATHVQGWIYSKALPQDAVMEKLASGELEYEPSGPAKARASRKAMFRKVGVIHEDHRYEVVMRNLSRTGARIEGLLNVPEGTDMVLDLGNGQLVVAVVRRAEEAAQGLEFETKLISDGADGLCTRHRVSPYALAAAGMPLAALPAGSYGVAEAMGVNPRSRPHFLQIETSPA